MELVRRLVLASLSYNILLGVKHIIGKNNTFADKLSRFQFQEAFRIAAHLIPSQTAIPVDLLTI